jgi:two-component system, LuxR family, response regulator FixJ
LLAPKESEVAARKVVIIDDDEAVLDSLEELLLAEGFAVEAFGSASVFLEDHPEILDACVVTDVRMPEMNGLELIEALRRRGALPPIIVITGHGDVPIAVRAMKLGARDFLEKPFDPDLLVAAIHESFAAAAPSPGGADAELARRLASLTPREHDVLEQLVLGRSNKVLGRELGISPRTVEIHRARVMEKMCAGSLSQLVRMAFVAGIDPDATAT